MKKNFYLREVFVPYQRFMKNAYSVNIDGQEFGLDYQPGEGNYQLCLAGIVTGAGLYGCR